MSKVHVKSGDRVIVIAGDRAGKKGKVLEVFPPVLVRLLWMA